MNQFQVQSNESPSPPPKAVAEDPRLKRRRRERVKIWFGWLFALVTTLILGNTLFIYSAATPGVFLAMMLKLHVWLGLTLTVAMVGFSVPHYLQRRRHANQRAKLIGYVLGIALLGAVGLGLTVVALGRNQSPIWVVRGHEFLFGAALVTFIAHRLVAIATPVWRYELAGLVIAAGLFLGFWAMHASLDKSSGSNSISLNNISLPGKADFLASPATTNTGHFLSVDDLANSDYCAKCHVEIAEQWEGSAHRFSSFNDPFYEKTAGVLQQNREPKTQQFCSGCHDPLVLLTGNVNQEVTRHTTNAQQGITCLACHSIVEVIDRSGNAGFVVAKPDHYPYFGSDDPQEQQMNLSLIRAKPEKHKQDFLKEFHRTSEFCLTCHKTSLEEHVNEYRWKRGPNDFDPWFDSTAGMNSALTFYNGEQVKSCQECHMPDVASNDPAARDGLARDHTFPAANSALAMVHNKPEWMKKTEEILKDCITIDIASAIDVNNLAPENRIFPLERTDAAFAPGSQVRVEVVVANTKVGHLFPSGTLDLNEPWLEFIVSDSNGKPILASGLMSEDRRLDPTAHRFDVVLLSKESNLIDIHNVEHFHSELYNNAIPLGQSDVIRFDFQVPELPSGEKLKLSARVRFRKFNQQYIEFVYGKNAPVFPIVEVCRDEVDVVVGEINPSAWEPILPTDKTAAEALARRMRNLGISHLRQRDTLNALWAFQQAAKITPNDPDLYIDMARCYLQTGNYSDDLEEVLRKADEVRPGFHKTGFFFGKLMAARGKFDKAIRAYDSILALFPDDRVVVNSKGIALYKSQKYQEAIDVFAHTLAIDPENVEAHNYCFLSHRNLGNKEQASFHEYSYLRYQPQESEKSIHELYRRRNPHADREANLQHVHPLHPPSEIQRLVDEGETYRYPHSDVQPKKVTEAKAPIPTGLAN